MKVFKNAHGKFQAERVGDVYMLRNSKATVGVLQLSSASNAETIEQSETTMVLNSDVQIYPEGRLALGVQQGNPDRYSYGGANSHKFCVDQ